MAAHQSVNTECLFLSHPSIINITFTCLTHITTVRQTEIFKIQTKHSDKNTSTSDHNVQKMAD